MTPSNEQNIESLVDQIFHLIEDSINTSYKISYDIFKYAADEGFKVSDLKDEDVINLITPKFQKLISEYLKFARENESYLI